MNINRIVQFWLPFAGDQKISDDEVRQRLFVSAGSLLAVPLCLYFLVREYLAQNYLIAWMLLGAVILLPTGIFLTRKNRYHRVIPRVILLYCMIMILVQILLERNAASLYLALVVPVVAVFMFGRREGLFWGLAWLLLLGSLLLMGEPAQMPSFDVVIRNFLTTYLVISGFSLGYETLRERAQRKADERNRYLEDERSELLAVQKDLAASEQRFRIYAEMASDWLYELDEEHRFVYVSPRFEALTGRSENLLGVSILEILGAYDADGKEDNMKRVLANQPFRDFRLKFPNAHGGTVTALTRGEPLFDEDGHFRGYLGSGTDITRYEEVQEELREKDRVLQHSRKMEALGQLTSGVAHDFNNLLTVIAGNLELFRFEHEGEIDTEQLVAAESAVRQAAELTGQLLAFARRQPLVPKEVDIGSLLENMAGMLKRTLGNEIDLQLSYPDDLWLCSIDQGQLENALLNLSLNARDAMKGSGNLGISASNRHGTGSEPDFVDITVSDDGEGMSEEIVSRVVEPFFSTKPSGEGTGLGLSMVYGYVTQSGGELKIESEPGKGTCITLSLPALEDRCRSHRESETDREIDDARPLKILVVEDEPEVRGVLEAMLVKMGHEPHLASGSEDMFSRLEKVGPDLIITDVILGAGLNGVELAEKVVRENPAMKILLISGYPRDALKKREASSDRQRLLSKPFTREQLAQAIGELMQE